MIKNSLEIFSRVKVHSLEWFKKNGIYNNDSNSFIVNNIRVPFNRYMQNLCDRYVTITLINANINDRIYYKVFEDGREWNWVEEFFDMSTVMNSLSTRINNYCNNFCIFKSSNICNNIECPFFVEEKGEVYVRT